MIHYSCVYQCFVIVSATEPRMKIPARRYIDVFGVKIVCKNGANIVHQDVLYVTAENRRGKFGTHIPRHMFCS